jgi:hypothetical protein
MLEASGAGDKPPRYVCETAPPFGDSPVPENAGAPGRTTVHTIAFPYNMGQDILTQIAGDHGG